MKLQILYSFFVVPCLYTNNKKKILNNKNKYNHGARKEEEIYSSGGTNVGGFVF